MEKSLYETESVTPYGLLDNDLSDPGLDLTLGADIIFGRVRVMSGLDANLELGDQYDNNVDTRVHVFAVVRISVWQQAGWFFEGHYGAIGQIKPHRLSTGIKWSFD